jgi:hypothetical protein
LSRTTRVAAEEEHDYYDLVPEGHKGIDTDEHTLARYRLSDARGAMWLDIELPEPLRFDEFVCSRCWLATHVSRRVADEVCNECA